MGPPLAATLWQLAHWVLNTASPASGAAAGAGAVKIMLAPTDETAAVASKLKKRAM